MIVTVVGVFVIVTVVGVFVIVTVVGMGVTFPSPPGAYRQHSILQEVSEFQLSRCLAAGLPVGAAKAISSSSPADHRTCFAGIVPQGRCIAMG